MLSSQLYIFRVVPPKSPCQHTLRSSLKICCRQCDLVTWSRVGLIFHLLNVWGLYIYKERTNQKMPNVFFSGLFSMWPDWEVLHYLPTTWWPLTDKHHYIPLHYTTNIDLALEGKCLVKPHHRHLLPSVSKQAWGPSSRSQNSPITSPVSNFWLNMFNMWITFFLSISQWK